MTAQGLQTQAGCCACHVSSCCSSAHTLDDAYCFAQQVLFGAGSDGKPAAVSSQAANASTSCRCSAQHSRGLQGPHYQVGASRTPQRHAGCTFHVCQIVLCCLGAHAAVSLTPCLPGPVWGRGRANRGNADIRACHAMALLLPPNALQNVVQGCTSSLSHGHAVDGLKAKHCSSPPPLHQQLSCKAIKPRCSRSTYLLLIRASCKPFLFPILNGFSRLADFLFTSAAYAAESFRQGCQAVCTSCCCQCQLAATLTLTQLTARTSAV